MDDQKIITVLIADDHALLRQGVISMLSDIKEIEFTGEAGNGQELMEKYITLKPDIILADISMPPLSGPDAVKQLIEKGYTPKVLFLSMSFGEDVKYCCYKAGGMGLISKNVSKAELLTAIRSVNCGKNYFSDDWDDEKEKELKLKFEGNPRFNYPQVNPGCLNKHEKKILVYISDGFTSVQIAEKMLLGKRTIDSYRCDLLKKLDLHSLPELISYAVKNLPDLIT